MAIVSLVWIATLLLMNGRGSLAFVHSHAPPLFGKLVESQITTSRLMAVATLSDSMESTAAYPATAPLVAFQPTTELSPASLQKKHFLMPSWTKRLFVRRWWRSPRAVTDTPNSEVLFRNVPSPVSVGHWLFCCMKKHPDVCMINIMLVLATAEVVGGMWSSPAAGVVITEASG
jgi:hypothetical protein